MLMLLYTVLYCLKMFKGFGICGTYGVHTTIGTFYGSFFGSHARLRFPRVWPTVRALGALDPLRFACCWLKLKLANLHTCLNLSCFCLWTSWVLWVQTDIQFLDNFGRCVGRQLALRILCVEGQNLNSILYICSLIHAFLDWWMIIGLLCEQALMHSWNSESFGPSQGLTRTVSPEAQYTRSTQGSGAR